MGIGNNLLEKRRQSGLQSSLPLMGIGNVEDEYFYLIAIGERLITPHGDRKLSLAVSPSAINMNSLPLMGIGNRSCLLPAHRSA